MDSDIENRRTSAEVIFRGKIQGVFFRVNTRKFARANGVKGCVMNCPDGSVKAVFEGSVDNIQSTIDKCLNEQPYARVSGHDVKWGEHTGKYREFDIRHSGGC